MSTKPKSLRQSKYRYVFILLSYVSNSGSNLCFMLWRRQIRAWKAPWSFCYLMQVSKTAPHLLSPSTVFKLQAFPPGMGFHLCAIFQGMETTCDPEVVCCASSGYKGNWWFLQKNYSVGISQLSEFDSVNSLFWKKNSWERLFHSCCLFLGQTAWYPFGRQKQGWLFDLFPMKQMGKVFPIQERWTFF